MIHKTTPTATAAPLQISTAPRENDIRLSVLVAPGAPLGMCEVQLGLGRGSRGKGERIGDDPAVHVAAVRRLAAHLVKYAQDYEVAYLQDTAPHQAVSAVQS